MFKKFSALFIVIVMALTASCSGETVELFAFIDENNSQLDCEGKTFTFVSEWYSEWYAFSDDTLPTESVEKMMKRFHSIKEEFNANFEMVQSNADEVAKLILTGDDVPEMFDLYSDDAYDLYKSNVLISLNQLSAVDLNDTKWGVETFIKYGKFDGEQYGFYPWNWEFIPQFSGVVIFNGEMISTFGGTHPYELQENGKWNWKNFENELKNYTKTENGIQYYGAILDSYEKLAKAAIFSNGGQIIEGDEDSGYKFGATSPASMEALEWLKGLNTDGVFADIDFTEFSLNKVAPYWIGESYYGTVFNPNDESNKNFAPAALSDYGFIQFPTGPKGSESDVGAYVYYNRRLNYISSVSDIEPENLGVIINYIFEPIDDSSQEGWKDLAKNFIFTENNNEKCFENFNFIIENIGYDYSVQMGSVCCDNLDDALSKIVKGTASISEALGSLESKIMDEIKK